MYASHAIKNQFTHMHIHSLLVFFFHSLALNQFHPPRTHIEMSITHVAQ